MTRATSLLPLCVLLATTGCAGFRAPLDWLGPKDVPRATGANPANRIVAIWQPAEGQGLNGLPGRGFAGQILFFPAKGETPVAVDGDVRIYVFDDQGDADEQMKPIHQFDFKDGGWEAQLVKGSLGPAYQVYVPYTRKGSHRAKCSLRIRLQPTVGTAVYSDVINVVLPGPTGDEQPAPIVNVSPVAGASGPVQSIRLTKGEQALQSAEPSTTVAGAAATNPADARIDRLERLIEQLAANRVPATSGSVQQTSHREPATDVPSTATNLAHRAPTIDRDETTSAAHPLGHTPPVPRVLEATDPTASVPRILDTFSERPASPPDAQSKRYRLASLRRENRAEEPTSHDRGVPSDRTERTASPRFLDSGSGWQPNE